MTLDWKSAKLTTNELLSMPSLFAELLGLINNGNGQFSEFDTKDLINEYNAINYSLPYMKDNKIHFFSLMAASHLIDISNYNFHIKYDDVEFEIR